MFALPISKEVMIKPEFGGELDQEMVDFVLSTLDAGEEPCADQLRLRFPDRDQDVLAVLGALADYRCRVARERSERASEGDVDGVLPPGTQIGDYVISGLMGRGAMGVVYRAQQTSLGGREVALKVLPRALVARDPRFAERFRREASLSAGIHHPNLAEVYGCASAEDTPCYAMRLVVGRTLHEVLARLSAGSARNGVRRGSGAHDRCCARLVRDLAGAVATIHDRGLVHRDVKPANVILEGAPEDDETALMSRPVLVDFGLLRATGPSDLTGSRTLLGTPAYASPEGQLGRDVDARADVFSLGVVLFDLLTLTAPNERPPASSGLPEIRRLNPDLDVRLAAIVEMATHERPTLRYSDAGAMRRDLDAWLRGEPVRACPISTLGKVALWSRRHPMRAVRMTAIGLVAVLVAACVALVLLQAVRLGQAASVAGRCEQRGDLLGAQDAYRVIAESASCRTWMFWLRDDATRAERYWGENRLLGEVCHFLREGQATIQRGEVIRGGAGVDSTQDAQRSYEKAHARILEVLAAVDTDSAEALGTVHDANVALGLLLWEARDSKLREWRRRLALETLASYLLTSPTYGDNGSSPSLQDGPRAASLRETAMRIAMGRDASVRDKGTAQAAVACLGLMPRADTFKMLLKLVGDDDAETRRLALIGTQNIWQHMLRRSRDAGQLIMPVDQQDVVRWATLAARCLSTAVGGSGALPCPPAWIRPGDVQRDALNAIAYVAWYRRALRIGQVPCDWAGASSEATAWMNRIELELDRIDSERSPGRVDGGADDELRGHLRTILCHLSGEALEFDNYDRTIWTRGGDGLAPVIENDGLVVEPSLAEVRFGDARPRVVGGAAVKAGWLYGETDDWENGAGLRFLKLIRPGRSTLWLRARVPTWATRAEISMLEGRAARWPLRGSGEVNVRVALRGTPFEVIRRASYDHEGPWSQIVERDQFSDAGEVELVVEVLNGNTSYRIDWLRICWEGLH